MSATDHGVGGVGTSAGKSQAPSDLLMKLARTTPYYRRNLPHICSFWVKGECKRGEECPYRHEKPTDPDDPLADQNIKDRYYGTNDPVAEKLLRRAATLPRLDAPEDKSITTLYVGNIGEKMLEKELRDHFYQYGEIRSITIVSRQQCAFVTYVNRTAAELAAEGSFNKLIIQVIESFRNSNVVLLITRFYCRRIVDLSFVGVNLKVNKTSPERRSQKRELNSNRCPDCPELYLIRMNCSTISSTCRREIRLIPLPFILPLILLSIHRHRTRIPTKLVRRLHL